MPASKPEPAILLDAAIDYLQRELLPTLTGYHRFQCRVTVNVLAQVRRELALAPAQAEAERARLITLLGRAGERDELSRELAARIRAGAIAIDDPALLDHLRRSLVEALQINNPRWIGAPDPPGDPGRG
ncbi:MAG TPA: DUF6285 domain-containing protein [Kofleriaceae bacterium]|nr:DUF6285 domain-containing protein [Kofleriaceae bacterium]